jgi:glycosyltransferase involved in cell wall biosynthesis
MCEISIIIPTLNEASTIGFCITKINEVFMTEQYDGEIIVSDSSTDDTAVIASKLGAKVVYPDKKGYGYAYRYALKNVKGKVIIFGDGDNTYDFSEIPKLIHKIQQNKADFVMGSRFAGEIRPGAMPWLHQYIGNPFLTFMLNSLFKGKLTDTHCGLRAISLSAINQLELSSNGMEFASEMIIEALQANLTIDEVPITYYKRNGKSKLNSIGDGGRHIYFMLKRFFNNLKFNCVV